MSVVGRHAAALAGGADTTPSRPAARSRVVHIRDRKIIPDGIVQRRLLRSYLEDGLRLMAGVSSYESALHGLIKPDDVILLKFNESASRAIGTTNAMTIVLVELLVNAGYNPEKLIILEGGTEGDQVARTRRPDVRWQGKTVRFGRSGEDNFIAALDEATAIINVPFLKTHHLATMTSCLKNLSHGLIRHPSRFHGNGCDPAIAEICSSANIRSKHKLNIVNGLRLVFDGSTDAGEKEIAAEGHLLLGMDPVACDTVGYSLLNEARRVRGLAPLLAENQVPKQLLTASDLGLGHFDEAQIALESIRA